MGYCRLIHIYMYGTIARNSISLYFQILQPLAQSRSKIQLQQQVGYKSFPRQVGRSCLPRRLWISSSYNKSECALEVIVRMIEQQHFERSTIIFIDYTGTSINEMLHRCYQYLSSPPAALPNPERGATRPYVPGGHAIDKSVAIRAFPLAGTTVASALQLDTCLLNWQEIATRDFGWVWLTSRDRIQLT